MSKVLIFVLVLSVLLSGAYYLIKDSINAHKESEQKISEIDSRIQSSKTLEEFKVLKKELMELHNSTDTIYKDIRSAYRDRYLFVKGVISSMERKK